MNKQCKFIKPDGNQCGAYTIDGSKYCFSHCPNPEVKQAKQQAVISGGKSENYKKLNLNLKPVVLNDAGDVVKFLNTVINELRSGQIPPKIASCCGFLVNQLLRALEMSNLERKITAIEKVITDRHFSQNREHNNKL